MASGHAAALGGQEDIGGGAEILGARGGGVGGGAEILDARGGGVGGEGLGAELLAALEDRRH
jgi:hypothetical protein